MAQADRPLDEPRAEGNKNNAYVPSEDDRSSMSSYHAQAGVKGIEAISQTWTKWALVSAYLGYVLHPSLWKIEFTLPALVLNADVLT